MRNVYSVLSVTDALLVLSQNLNVHTKDHRTMKMGARVLQVKQSLRFVARNCFFPDGEKLKGRRPWVGYSIAQDIATLNDRTSYYYVLKWLIKARYLVRT